MWFENGDRNTKLFSCMGQSLRRKINHIDKIVDEGTGFVMYGGGGYQ
jgi:hypothetical protein